MPSSFFAFAKHPVEERPAPFHGKTLPSASLTRVSYGQRLASWMEGVQREEEKPTSEQLAVLNRVAQRVLLEFRLEKKASHWTGVFRNALMLSALC